MTSYSEKRFCKNPERRLLPNGETLARAYARILSHGGDILRLQARRQIKALVEQGWYRDKAEDRVLCKVFGKTDFPEKIPALWRVNPVGMNIEWKHSRKWLLAAKTETEWLITALYVRLPRITGIGLGSRNSRLLGMLERMRANPKFADYIIRRSLLSEGKPVP